MAILRRFCFWFSVRLGSIVVGISCLVQWCIWLMLSIISLGNKEDVTKALREIVEILSIKNRYFMHLVNDPSILSISGTIFFFLCIISSILLIYGAFRFYAKFLYPFMFLNAIYIIMIFILHVLLMLSFKRREYGLGSLILFSNIGAVILFFFMYKWACVYSFFCVIRDLKSELGQQRLERKERRRQMKNMVDTRYLYNVRTNC